MRDAVKISVGNLAGESLPALPEPRQSAELVVEGSGKKSTVYLLGGIGPDGDVSRTLGDAFRFETGTSQWAKLPNVIPDSRGMFRAALHDGAIWVFGGNIWDGQAGHPGSLPTEVLRWELGRDKAGFAGTGKHLPRPRRSFAGAVMDKKFYCVGGLGADMKIVAPVDVFDFASGQWSTISALSPGCSASWQSWTASSIWREVTSRAGKATSSRRNRSRSTIRHVACGRLSSTHSP